MYFLPSSPVVVCFIRSYCEQVESWTGHKNVFLFPPSSKMLLLLFLLLGKPAAYFCIKMASCPPSVRCSLSMTIRNSDRPTNNQRMISAQPVLLLSLPIPILIEGERFFFRDGTKPLICLSFFGEETAAAASSSSPLPSVLSYNRISLG